MDVTFIEQGTDDDWNAMVLHGGMHVGTIKLSDDLSFYRYFEDPWDESVHPMDDHDLGMLKARITVKLAGPPQRSAADSF